MLRIVSLRRLSLGCLVWLVCWVACAVPLPSVEGLPCKSAQDCGEKGLVCARDLCRVSCLNGESCPTGRSCEAGVCLPPKEEPSAELAPEPAREKAPEPRAEPKPEPASELSPEPISDDAGHPQPDRLIDEPIRPPDVRRNCDNEPKPKCEYRGPANTVGVGECKAPVLRCKAGKWVCEGEVLPTFEICNAKDDDCNGAIDEHISNTDARASLPCLVKGKLGKCARGRAWCDGGVLKCHAYVKPDAKETCNGLDDDCDGLVDEDTGARGCVMTIAGNDPSRFDGAPNKAELANFWEPVGLAQDSKTGDIYIVEAAGHRLRRYSWQAKEITTVMSRELGDPLNTPNAILFDPQKGSLFLSNTLAHTIYSINIRTGISKLFAGKPGQNDYKNGPALDSLWYFPKGLALDNKGTLYVADAGNHVIRTIDKKGSVGLLIGTPQMAGYVNGDTKAAKLQHPIGIVLGRGGLLVTENLKHSIRRLLLPSKVLGNWAGSEKSGALVENVDRLKARFRNPHSLSIDKAGNVYVADRNNNAIRKIDTSGKTTTLVKGAIPGGGTLEQPRSVLVLHDQTLAFIDTNGVLRRADIRKPVPTIERLAGTGWSGLANRRGHDARFNGLHGIAISKSGLLYVADRYNHMIRRIEQIPGQPTKVTSIIGTSTGPGYLDGYIEDPATKKRVLALADNPTAVASADDTRGIYFTDRNGLRRADESYPNPVASTSASLVGQSNQLCKWIVIEKTTPKPIAPCVYNGESEPVGRGARGLALGEVGTVKFIYIADTENHRILKVDRRSAQVSLVAGKKGDPRYLDGTGAGARFNRPHGIVVTYESNKIVLYVADMGNHCIRRIDQNNAVTTFSGTCGTSGKKNGKQATFTDPVALALYKTASADVLYVLERETRTIRELPLGGPHKGVVTHLFGIKARTDGGYLNGPLTNALYFGPNGLVLDTKGNMYLSEIGNNVVRKIEAPHLFKRN